MGHLVGKDVYRRLGKKVDNLTMRAPWNETLHAILKELYTAEEAELVVAMPYGMSSLGRLKRVTRMEEGRLLLLLEGMCDKGLVIDILADEEMHYAPSPIVIGFFEFTMMRTGRAGLKELSRLFHEYMLENPAFLDANLGHGEQVNVMRTMPHKEALVQVAAGLANVALLAPVWMQVVHLLLADALWIAFVLLGARALSLPRRSEAPAVTSTVPA